MEKKGKSGLSTGQRRDLVGVVDGFCMSGGQRSAISGIQASVWHEPGYEGFLNGSPRLLQKELSVMSCQLSDKNVR